MASCGDWRADHSPVGSWADFDQSSSQLAVDLVLAAASGVGLFLTFYPASIWFLAWVALVPWTIALARCSSRRRAILLGAVTGAVWFFASWDFVRTSGVQNWGGRYLGAWTVLVGCGVGSMMLSSGLLVWLHQKRSWPLAAAVGFAWIAGEEARDGIVRMLGGTTTDGFRLAATQVNVPFVIIAASLGGAPLVSLLVACANGCLATVVIPSRGHSVRPFSSLANIAIGLIVFGVFAFSNLASHHNEATSSPVMAVIPESRRNDSLSPRQLSLIRRADLVIWPELALENVVEEGGANPQLNGLAEQVDRPFLIGARRWSEPPLGLYNSVLFVSSDGRVVASYDKRFLAPFRETRPPIAEWLQIGGNHSLSNFTAGHSAATLPLAGGLRAAVGICHDVCFPEWGCDSLRSTQAGMLIVCGSESFADSRQWEDLTLACTQLRAAETGRSILRCVSGGWSAAIDPRGQIVGSLYRGEPFLSPRLPIQNHITPFVQLGRAGCLLMISVGAVLADATRRRRQRHSMTAASYESSKVG